MKTVFISAKVDLDVEKAVKVAMPLLPKKVGLAMTIQLTGQMQKAKAILEQAGKEVVVTGQVLGCNPSAVMKDDVDAYLYVGSGRFHPMGIAVKTQKPVIIADPADNSAVELPKEDVEKVIKKNRGALLKFYAAKEVGVIVTIKPGQENMIRAMKMKEMFPDKNIHIFICDELPFGQLENFPFVEVWVNTACPRIGTDDFEKSVKPMLNFEDIVPTNFKIEPNFVKL